MKSKKIGAFDAKTRLSELLDLVHETGAVYVITKRGVPVAELRPLTPSTGLRYGGDAGQIMFKGTADTATTLKGTFDNPGTGGEGPFTAKRKE